MNRKPPRKTYKDLDLIDAEMLELKREIEEFYEHECPICKAPSESSKAPCSRCESRLSDRRDAGKHRIIDYFNDFQALMEQWRQTTENDTVSQRLSTIDEQIGKDPSNGNLWFQKGVILTGIEADKKALNAFNAVLGIDPNNSRAWIAKAFVLTRLKRFSQASKCYQKALKAMMKTQPEERLEEQESLLSTKAEDRYKRGKSGLTNGLTNGLRIKGSGPTNGLTNGLTKRRKRGGLGLTNGLTNGVSTKRKREKRGLTNGLTNGVTTKRKKGKLGLTNGLINGITNGVTTRRKRGKLGFTNGFINGLTNGLTNGVTNGVTTRRKRGKLGLTNGLTNGITNGLTNGLTNGFRALKRGITNGVTNGNGITNGLGRGPGVLGPKSHNLRLAIVPIAVLLLILMPHILNMLNTPPKTVSIDGDFSDWRGVEAVSDMQEGLVFNPNVDIIAYRVLKEAGFLSFCLEVEGVMMAGQPEYMGRRADMAHIFIDSDQEYSTGYKIKGIGADEMMQIYGRNGTVHRAELFFFSGEEQDWNNWEKRGQVSAVAKGNALETQISTLNLNLANGGHIDVYFHMESWDGFEDFSDTVISDQKGVLVVKQQGVGEDVINGYSNALLKLEIKALNSDLTLRGLTLTRTGKGEDSDVDIVRLVVSEITIAAGVVIDGRVKFEPRLLITEGETKTLYVETDLSGAAQAENSIGFKIMGIHDVIPNKGTVSLEQRSPPDGAYDNSYIQGVPEGMIIDGAFADWANVEKDVDNIGDIDDANLDIAEYAAYVDTNSIAFYLKVDGEVAKGKAVPFKNDMSVPSKSLVEVSPADKDRDGIKDDIDPYPNDFDNDALPDEVDTDDDNDNILDYTDGGTDKWLVQPQTGVRIYIGPLPSPPPRTGEDVIYIFIDSDDDMFSGYPVVGVGADHLIEVKGKHGEITSSTYSEFVGSEQGNWSWDLVEDVDAAVDFARLEVSLDLSTIALPGNFSVYFQTMSWDKLSKDDTVSVLKERGTRTPEGDNVVINEVFPSPGSGDTEWIEFYNPTDSDINLNGWYLDSSSKFGYFQFSNDTIVPANSYLVVDEAWFGSNFLASTDTLTLYDDSQDNIDYVAWEGVTSSSNSWARYYELHTGEPYDTDSSTDWYLSSSITKGSQNDQYVPEFLTITLPIFVTVVIYLIWKRRTKIGTSTETEE